MTEREHMDGRYFTKGNVVHKAPLKKGSEGGGFSLSIGAEAAEFVATALNLYEGGHAGCMCPHCNPQPSN